jgi:uncharacterized iron-regulated membrane protein
MVVNFSRVYLVFPQSVSAAIMGLLPSRDPGTPRPLVKGAEAQCIDADRAIAIALARTPGAPLISIGLPLRTERTERPYGVSLARPGAGRGAPEVAAAINPWSGELIDPRRFHPAQTVLAWQQALHFGEGLGWVWRILVCLSGLLPAIFALPVLQCDSSHYAAPAHRSAARSINLLGQTHRRRPGYMLSGSNSPGSDPGYTRIEPISSSLVRICEIGRIWLPLPNAHRRIGLGAVLTATAP